MPAPNPVLGSPLERRVRPALPSGTREVAFRVTVGAADALLIAMALLCATAIRIPDSVDVDVLPRQVALVTGLMLVGLANQGAYDLRRVRNGQELFTRLGLGAILGLSLVVLGSYVLPDLAIGRGVFALHALLAVPLLLLWRRLLFDGLRESALRPRALVLGELAIARKVAAALLEAPFGGSEVVGLLLPEPHALGAEEGEPGAVPVLGGYDKLVDVVERLSVSQAIVVAGSRDERLPVEDVLALSRQGLSVEDGSAAYEGVTGKLLVEKLTPGWLLFANAFEPSELERLVRRLIGIVVAGAGLVVLSPLLLVTAALVRLDSRGPILFRQARVGQGGRVFDLLKFRTMRDRAEAETGPVWARENDPRVTRVGRILRSTRLDELPQLWNVVRGDLFFVGPRPERPEFVERLSREVPHYAQRHSVMPGITGWAQINYRYGASVEDSIEKLHYDLFYIQNMNLLLDLEIVVGTIRVVLGAVNKN